MAHRIAIIGPGAIGSLFAALLARQGHNVVCLDHRPARAAQRKAHGIRLISEDTHLAVPINSTADYTKSHPADLILVCTKAYDTPAVANALPRCSAPHTIVVSLQNGIGNIEHLHAYAPTHCVAGTTAMGALLENPLTVRWTGRGITRIAPFGETPVEDAEAVCRLFSEAVGECRTQRHAATLLWEKLIINAAINPVAVRYHLTNGAILSHTEARETAFTAAREAVAVAKALGIPLPYVNPEAVITRVCRQTAPNRCSMLEDVHHGRRTEIDAITGVILAYAKQVHVPTPVNETLYQSVANLTVRTHFARR